MLSMEQPAKISLIYNSTIITSTPTSFSGHGRSLLVCHGFLRRNNVNPQDIATIVSKFFASDRVTIKEDKTHKMLACGSYKKSMIAFDKNLFNLVNNGNYNGTNTINVEIKALNNKCDERNNRRHYKHSQFLINEIGIISIDNTLPKSRKEKVIEYFRESIENNSMETFDEIYYKFNSNYHFIDIDKQYKSYCLQWYFSLPKSIRTPAGTFIRFTKKHGYNVVDTINYAPHSHTLRAMRSNNTYDESLSEKYHIGIGDSICFRIEKINDNDKDDKDDNDDNDDKCGKKYTMYFAKNGKFDDYFGKELVSQNNNKADYDTDFKNGQILLDFDKCSYYFAMSIPRCDCKETAGFEYQITVT